MDWNAPEAAFKPPELVPFGVTQGDVDGVTADPLPLIKITSATRLRHLTKEFQFFTPALMYLWIQLTVDPLQHFLYERPHIHFCGMRFEQPIFDGLDTAEGDLVWNHVLMACPEKHWAEFRSYIPTVALRCTRTNALHRLRWQELEVVDPLEMNTRVVLPSQLPLVPVSALGLDSTEGTFYLERHRGPWPKYGATRSNLVSPEVRRFAKEVAKQNPFPYEEPA